MEDSPIADPVTLIISVAISATSALISSSRLNDTSNDTGTQVQKQGNKAPRAIPYGRARMTGVPVYRNVLDANNSQRLDVFACGIGEVTAIRNVLIDDVSMTDAINAKDVATDPYNGATVVNDPDTGEPIWPNDPDKGIFSSAGLVNGFNKQCLLQLRTGHLDTTYSQLGIDVGDGEWTQNHRGRRVVQVYIKSERNTQDEDIRIMGEEYKVTVDVDGLPLYDPRYHSSRSSRDWSYTDLMMV
ncbi:hypothetical protein JCM19241_5968 [Vibrio ishigakensis]|uniref:Uncharacterized protein n=1 Tax=Vibrio ishigakensis TaxID=1481914 RepID=A0A0B8QJ45_9VIBR|nr:hypothetical protein JCM19241_5968 [Vibrio ishigakensis]